MKGVRKVMMIATLAATGLLVVLSIAGAFLGVDGAKELFNSPAMIVFWIALTAVFLSGFVFFKKLLRSPGALLAHVGPVLVLVGSMAGSLRGHAVAARVLGESRVPMGYMRIYEGESTDTITDEMGQAIARLPFEIRLEDFWVEHYSAPGPWRLGVDAPAGRPGQRRRGAEVAWAEGREVPIPFIDARLKVLRYLPHARPAFDESAVPTLEVIEADGRRSVVPAKVGQEFDLTNPSGRLKIVKVFNHLLVRNGEVVDVPGSNANPAVKVLFESPDGAQSHRYAFAAAAMTGHGQGEDGVQLHYALPTESGAVADETSELPAMEVVVRGRQNEELRGWLIPRDTEHPFVLSLAPVLGLARSSRGAQHDPNNAFLMLVGRTGAVRDYLSRLTVLGPSGEPALEQVIEVNHPLHYGGYHFYQHSYDSNREQFTVLSVHSDSGLSLVWAGFFLLCLGVMWLFWFRPVWAYFKGGQRHGN